MQKNRTCDDNALNTKKIILKLLRQIFIIFAKTI